MKTLSKQFIAGLIAGEGCFSTRPTTGNNKSFAIQIYMHSRDYELLDNVMESLGYGHLYMARDGYACQYAINRGEDIIKFGETIALLLSGYKEWQWYVFWNKFIEYQVEAGKRKSCNPSSIRVRDWSDKAERARYKRELRKKHKLERMSPYPPR